MVESVRFVTPKPDIEAGRASHCVVPTLKLKPHVNTPLFSYGLFPYIIGNLETMHD